MPLLLTGATRLFPIIGDPIIYARSPEFFSASLQARGANALCVPMQVALGSLEPVMQALAVTPNVDGILVTMPHKFEVTRHCATLSETSRLFGAVSVIRRNADGSWHGDSQDGASFVKAQIDQGATVTGARALLIGAGGAGSAIAIALLDAGLGELVVHDIDERRMTALVHILNERNPGMVKAGPPDPTGCDLLCHATNLGMTANDPLPVAPELLTPALFVGDVIAGHGETALIRAARLAGCKTATGDEMVRAVQGMMVDYMLSL